jgi:hypothetical protein
MEEEELDANAIVKIIVIAVAAVASLYEENKWLVATSTTHPPVLQNLKCKKRK